MPISAHFASLGAPLRNVQWSWGAATRDGRTILRVWDDEIISRNDKKYVRLINRKAYADKPRNLGFRERVDQLETIKRKGRGFVLLLTAVDKRSQPRRIANYDESGVWEIGEIIDVEGDEYGELREFVSSEAFRGGR